MSAFLDTLYWTCSNSSNFMTSVSKPLQYSAFSDNYHYQTKPCCHHNKGATSNFHVDATNDSTLKSSLYNFLCTPWGGEGEGQNAWKPSFRLEAEILIQNTWNSKWEPLEYALWRCKLILPRILVLIWDIKFNLNTSSIFQDETHGGTYKDDLHIMCSFDAVPAKNTISLILNIKNWGLRGHLKVN